MKTAVILCSLVVVLSAASSSPSAAPGTSPIPDTNLGLVKGSVFEAPTPPPVTPDSSDPGEQPVVPRPYVIAPPRIPHGIADFLPITPKRNVCVDCHAVPDKKPGEPTPLPPSHYTDLRSAPDRVGSRIAGARYVCVSCHVPTTDAPDLVENRFRR